MAIGDIITATRYNQIQSTVEFVLGVGNGDAGYGIQPTSSQLQEGNTVIAVDINKLRADLLAIYIHQRGSNTGFSTKKFNAATDVDSANNIFTITNHELATGQRVVYTVSASTTVIPGLINNQQYLVEVIDQSQFILKSIDEQVVNIIGVSTGTHRFLTNLEKQITEKVDDSDYITLDNLANLFLANRNNYNIETLSNNFTLETAKTISVRRTAWGGTRQAQSVFHEVRVDFASPDQRRHFFNTGSVIQFEASLSNFPGSSQGLLKFNDWSQLFTSTSSVRFTSFETSAIGSGTALPVGNFNLTPNYQTIFIKSGSGLYSDNTYVIKAKSIDTKTISFLIEFNDSYAGTGNPNFPGDTGVDEPVEGTLTSTVSQIRATGSVIDNIIKVTTPSPQYTNLKEVSFSLAPPPPPLPPPPPPPDPIIVPCNSAQGASRAGRGFYTYTLNLGTSTGRSGITYDGYRSVPDNFTITWNGQTVTTGFVTGKGSLTFIKTSAEPQTATLTVDATRRGTLFDWKIICPGAGT